MSDQLKNITCSKKDVDLFIQKLEAYKVIMDASFKEVKTEKQRSFIAKECNEINELLEKLKKL